MPTNFLKGTPYERKYKINVDGGINNNFSSGYVVSTLNLEANTQSQNQTSVISVPSVSVLVNLCIENSSLALLETCSNNRDATFKITQFSVISIISYIPFI